MSLTFKQQQQIEDKFFRSGYTICMLRCGLCLKAKKSSAILIKISTEYPEKHRPYGELLEDLYRVAKETGFINDTLN